MQISAGIDVPLMLATGLAEARFNGLSSADGQTGFEYMVKPWVALEFPIASDVNMVAQAQAHIDRLDQPTVLPAVSLGISW